jgi:sialic acid synthase SpsE
MTNLFDSVNIYADVCSNHNGNHRVYEQLVRGIIDAGAIPKIQLFSAKTFDRDWDLPDLWVPSIFRPTDLDYAMTFNPLALKIASVESTFTELVHLAGSTGLPLLISTGGMTDAEIIELCEVLDPYSGNVCLMHCVSIYPTPLELACMSRISFIADIMEDMLLQPYLGWSSHHSAPELYDLLPIALAYDANQVEVHVKQGKYATTTPDLASSISIEDLEVMRKQATRLAPVWGDPYEEVYIPPDRPSILEWRKRWQLREED